METRLVARAKFTYFQEYLNNVVGGEASSDRLIETVMLQALNERYREKWPQLMVAAQHILTRGGTDLANVAKMVNYFHPSMEKMSSTASGPLWEELNTYNLLPCLIEAVKAHVRTLGEESQQQQYLTNLILLLNLLPPKSYQGALFCIVLSLVINDVLCRLVLVKCSKWSEGQRLEALTNPNSPLRLLLYFYDNYIGNNYSTKKITLDDLWEKYAALEKFVCAFDEEGLFTRKEAVELLLEIWKKKACNSTFSLDLLPWLQDELKKGNYQLLKKTVPHLGVTDTIRDAVQWMNLETELFAFAERLKQDGLPPLLPFKLAKLSQPLLSGLPKEEREALLALIVSIVFQIEEPIHDQEYETAVQSLVAAYQETRVEKRAPVSTIVLEWLREVLYNKRATCGDVLQLIEIVRNLPPYERKAICNRRISQTDSFHSFKDAVHFLALHKGMTQQEFDNMAMIVRETRPKLSWFNEKVQLSYLQALAPLVKKGIQIEKLLATKSFENWQFFLEILCHRHPAEVAKRIDSLYYFIPLADGNEFDYNPLEQMMRLDTEKEELKKGFERWAQSNC